MEPELPNEVVWRSQGGAPPAPEATGLYHFAIRYASRRDLAAALKCLLDAGIAVDSSSDCGGIADWIYLRDPDDNGLELTWDRPPDRRPNPLPADDRPGRASRRACLIGRSDIEARRSQPPGR